VFTNTATSRGLTGPALASMLTGLYPRDHDIRDCNETPDDLTLPQRFQDAGYVTFGFSSNQCQLIDKGVDVRECTSFKESEASTRRLRDEILLEKLLDDLDDLSSRKSLFLWLHLTHPHSPFETVAPWYQEFHPETYEGDLVPASSADLDDITLRGAEYDDEDRYHFEAVYASQLRESDDHTGQVLDKLDELGRYQDAIIVFGADHGEELTAHNNYFHHGCSPYNSVIDVVYSFRAPGRIPGGLWFEDWVSITDVAPTVVELASGVEWDGPVAGRSLVDVANAGEVDDVPVYFERGLETAGITWHTYKYILSGDTEFNQCKPFQNTSYTYPTEPEELYDLMMDPDETDNLIDQGLAVESELRTALCDWVMESSWVSSEELAVNRLVIECENITGNL